MTLEILVLVTAFMSIQRPVS